MPPSDLTGSVSGSSYSRTSYADLATVNADGLPEAPDTVNVLAGSERRPDIPAPGIRATRPFRSLAVGVTLGSAGIGLQFATPINSKFNLRTDASFLSYEANFHVHTIPIDSHLHLASVSSSLDWAPRGGNFHISPGVTLYEDTHVNATIDVPGNQVIVIDGESYTSDPSDPIHGSAYAVFGRRVAPRLTVGYGNVIRHHTAGFTFPVEIGFEYIRTPTGGFQLTGSSCDSFNNCSPINSDPSTHEDIQEDQEDLLEAIRSLRFFPVLSFGVSYKFGH